MDKAKAFELYCEIMRLIEEAQSGELKYLSKDGKKVVVQVNIEKKSTLIFLCDKQDEDAR